MSRQKQWTLTSLAMMGLGLPMVRVWADVIDTSGQEPWERCGYCHGIDGISANGRFPHLAGQDEGYLQRQLHRFAEGQRRNDDGVMQAQAEALSDAELNAVTQYFAAQDAPTPVLIDPADETPQAALQHSDTHQLYQQGDSTRGLVPCADCHGQQAQGSTLAPALAAQHAQYLEKQLNDFASGQRNGAHSGMARVAKALKPEERSALARFLAGLKRLTKSVTPSASGHSVSAIPVTANSQPAATNSGATQP